jgi:hypothetical protein
MHDAGHHDPDADFGGIARAAGFDPACFGVMIITNTVRLTTPAAGVVPILFPSLVTFPAKSFGGYRRGCNDEAIDDFERAQPQLIGNSRATYLRHDDARADQGDLRRSGQKAEPRRFISSVQP